MSRALLLVSLLSALPFARPARAQNEILGVLVREDQDSQSGKNVARSDDERVKMVLQYIGEDMVKSPRDRYNAALILEHTAQDSKGTKLASKSVDNYLLAHYLAISAFSGGIKDARYLIAASLDRYLSFTEGVQKYGTNIVVDPASGKALLVPVDRKTSDAERAQYGVPPLATLLEKYPEQPRDTIRQ